MKVTAAMGKTKIADLDYFLLLYCRNKGDLGANLALQAARERFMLI